MSSYPLHRLTQKIIASPIFRFFHQKFFGQTALALVQSGTTWRLFQGSLVFGSKKEVEISWLELDQTALEKERSNANPLLTILDESEIVMGTCNISPCRSDQMQASLELEIAKWIPFQKENQTFTYAIWHKSKTQWQIGLFATSTSSLAQRLNDQALEGYRADRCLPESLALLAYHLAQSSHSKCTLAIHVRAQSALFMIIGESKILAQQTAKGNFWSLNTSNQAKQQARQIAMSLQLRHQELCSKTTSSPPQWIVTGLRENELWESLNISLAPPEKGVKSDLTNQGELDPLIQGLFAMQFQSKWPDANFLTASQRFLSPHRLWMIARLIATLSTALITLCLCNCFGKAKALEMKTRKDFGQLARLMNHRIIQEPRSALSHLHGPAFQQKGLELNTASSLAFHLKRWRGQIAIKPQEPGFKALDELLILLAKIAEPFFSQGLRVEQLLVKRALMNRGQSSDLQLQLICAAKKGELLGKFLDQIQKRASENHNLVKMTRRGNRAIIQIPLTPYLASDRVSLLTDDAL